EEFIAGQLVSVEKILGQRIGLIVGSLPGSFGAFDGARRQIAQPAFDDALSGIKRGRDAGKLVSVQKADHVFVESIGRKSRGSFQTGVAVTVGINSRREAFDQTLDLRARRLVARCVREPRQARDVLAKTVTRRKGLRVVPTAHVFAGRRQTGALAVYLEHAVFVERHVGRLDAAKL